LGVVLLAVEEAAGCVGGVSDASGSLCGVVVCAGGAVLVPPMFHVQLLLQLLGLHDP
jgi:hypothetical protein